MKVTNIGNKILSISKDFRILPNESAEVDDKYYNALSAYEAVGHIRISKKSQKAVEEKNDDEAMDVKAEVAKANLEAPEKPKKGKKK